MYARVAASVAAGGGPANATGRRTSAIPRRRAGPCRRIPLAAGYGVVWWRCWTSTGSPWPPDAVSQPVGVAPAACGSTVPSPLRALTHPARLQCGAASKKPRLRGPTVASRSTAGAERSTSSTRRAPHLSVTAARCADTTAPSCWPSRTARSTSGGSPRRCCSARLRLAATGLTRKHFYGAENARGWSGSAKRRGCLNTSATRLWRSTSTSRTSRGS